MELVGYVDMVKIMKLTQATFTNDGIKEGDKIRIFGIKKPWYKRLFHFLTFGRFDYSIVTSVDSETTLTIK